MLPSDRSSLASPANRASLLAGAALAALGAIGLGTPAAAQDATQDPPTADQPDGVDEAVQDYIEGEAPPPGTRSLAGVPCGDAGAPVGLLLPGARGSLKHDTSKKLVV